MHVCMHVLCDVWKDFSPASLYVYTCACVVLGNLVSAMLHMNTLRYDQVILPLVDSSYGEVGITHFTSHLIDTGSQAEKSSILCTE
jgi:hypothetical protein